MEVIEEKKWAEGLSQSEFEVEYQRRNPFSDVIPDVRKYVYAEVPKNYGIDPFNPELMEVENNDIKKKEKKEDIGVFCRGCNKEFTHPKSKFANKKIHEKTCKTLLAMKL